VRHRIVDLGVNRGGGEGRGGKAGGGGSSSVFVIP
jgi:hypothetical protein